MSPKLCVPSGPAINFVAGLFLVTRDFSSLKSLASWVPDSVTLKFLGNSSGSVVRENQGDECGYLLSPVSTPGMQDFEYNE